MSQLLFAESELRQLWPKGIAYLPQQPPAQSVNGVPEDDDLLDSWAYVGPIVDAWPCCQKTLLSRAVPGDIATVKVYGVVSDARLTSLGNWTTRAEDAAFASRWLELSSGGQDDVFAVQTSRLQAIQRYVAYSLRSKLQQGPGSNNGALRCRQMLFTKVLTDKPKPVSTLAVGDDPLGAAAAVQDEWVVTCHIPISRVTPAGEVKSVSTYGVKTGDFVEAEIGFDVILRRGRGKKGVEVRFVLLGVVKMCSEEEFKQRTKAGKDMEVE